MASALSATLGLTYEEVYKKLTNSPETWEYVVIQDYVAADTVDKLKALVHAIG